MKNKANKLTLSLSALAVTMVLARPDEAWAQIGISQLRAPDNTPNPALSVDNDGNVSIGTTSPLGMFHVNSSASASSVLGALLEPNLVNSGFNQIYLGRTPSTYGCSTFTYTYDAANAASSFLSLGLYNNSYALNVLGNGNVGLGTSSPLAPLHINSSATGSSILSRILQPNLNHGNFSQIYFGRTPSSHGCSTVTYTYNGDNPSDSFLSLGLWGSSFTFNVRGNGNVGIGTTAPNAMLDVAGQIRCTTLLLTSDRNAKAELVPVNNREVLHKVASLPITTWQYTNAPGVRHLGPMAQDFKAAFELGEDDKTIATVDAAGVALASIQALYEMVQEKDSEIAALKRELSSLKTELAGVKETVTDRLVALEKGMAKETVEANFRPEAAR